MGLEEEEKVPWKVLEQQENAQKKLLEEEERKKPVEDSAGTGESSTAGLGMTDKNRRKPRKNMRELRRNPWKKKKGVEKALEKLARAQKKALGE